MRDAVFVLALLEDEHEIGGIEDAVQIRVSIRGVQDCANQVVQIRLVDTAIVGRLGTEQLAGLAIAATVLSFIFAGANFLTYGTTERVARPGSPECDADRAHCCHDQLRARGTRAF